MPVLTCLQTKLCFFIEFPLDVVALMLQTADLISHSHKAIYILLDRFSIQSLCSFYYDVQLGVRTCGWVFMDRGASVCPWISATKAIHKLQYSLELGHHMNIVSETFVPWSVPLRAV
jgi:hypothetical protein